MEKTATAHIKGQKLKREDHANGKDRTKSKALYEALKAIKDDLSLSDAQIGKYLHIAKTTVNLWLNKKSVPYSSTAPSNDVERLINFVAIHRNLYSFFRKPEGRKEWLHVFRPDLKDIPHALMEKSFEELLKVRKYLDYMRGRGV